MTPRQALTSVPYALSADVASYAVTASQVLCNKYEFVGVSTTTSGGGAGVLKFTEMCQADYPNSRMCTSEEIIKTINVTSIFVPAWVNPRSYTDTASWAVESCSGWRRGTGTGMLVVPNGRFEVSACNYAYPIACCAPVP